MLFLDRIVERKVQEAMPDGAFDNLEGRGKPLDLEEDTSVPEDLRMTYKILKNAGFVPPELAWRKEILRLQDLLACTLDPETREETRKQLVMKQLQFDEAMQRMGRSLPADYRQTLFTHLNGNPAKAK